MNEHRMARPVDPTSVFGSMQSNGIFGGNWSATNLGRTESRHATSHQLSKIYIDPYIERESVDVQHVQDVYRVLVQ
jgi:hypothetical protein